MKKVSLLLSALFLLICNCISQANPEGFTGFGRLPVKTPDSLLQKLKNAPDIEGKISATLGLTAFHASLGTTDSVIFYAKAIEEELNKSGLDEAIKANYQIKLHHTMARAYDEKGLFDEAMRYYLSGVTAGEKMKNASVVNDNKTGMANIYFARKEYDKAVLQYKDVLKNSRSPDLSHNIYKQLGIIYLEKNDLPLAKSNLDKALQYFQQNQQLKNELVVRLNLGIIAEKSNATDSAFNMYNEVKNMAMGSQFFDVYINAGQRLGDLMIARKDYENAKMLLSMVYANAIQWEDLEAQQKVLNSLRNVHAITGDFKNAYAIMGQYMRASNEILEQQNKKEVSELEIKYNTVQKEKEILSKNNELQRQKTVKYGILIGFLVVLIPIIGLLYLYYQKLQTQSKLNTTMAEMNEQKITAMLKEKEFELLKASVDGQEKERKRIAEELHDSIGGNLAAIKLQLSNQKNGNEVDGLLQQVDDTYQQVRNLSHDLVPEKFTNSGFTELVSGYLKQFDVPGKTSVSFQSYPKEAINELDTALKVELFKVVQELMTNAQKHSGASKIEVQLSQMDGLLKLLFEDNGKGFALETLKDGMGFRNIRERLSIYDGSVSIDSSPSRGVVVDIEIPLKAQLHEA